MSHPRRFVFRDREWNSFPHAALRSFALLTCIALATFASAADQNDTANEQLWEKANLAYSARQYDTGHQHVKVLLESNPGDAELAWKCLERILRESARQNVLSYYRPYNQILKRSVGRAIVSHGYASDPWTQFAAQRICSLHRIDQEQMNAKLLQQAVEVVLNYKLRNGRVLEAVQLIDGMVREYPRDPFWRISQASVYHQIDSAETGLLYERLLAEMDVDHPDSTIRQHWREFSDDMENRRQEIPEPIVPLLAGSPLQQMKLDDPESVWARVAANPVRSVPGDIDRLAARALSADELMILHDRGETDPARILDLHLLSQSQASLLPLRKFQAERFVRENKPPPTNEAETLYFARRNAWLPDAQQRLLVQANQMLWAGRAQAALRSFEDVLKHASDEMIRDTAQVGYWAALSHTGEAATVDEMLAGVAPDREYGWLGKPTEASTICELLLANKAVPKNRVAPTLKDLTQQVVHIPPVSPWGGGLSADLDLVANGRDLLICGRNLLAMYDADNPTKPLWSSSHGPSKSKSHHSGYFRPRFDGPLLYTRFGFDSLPNCIAAMERSTGRPLWSNKSTQLDRNGRPPERVPLGDPTLADGLLYYLQWSTGDFGDHRHGRRLSMVCYDSHQLKSVWDSTIATSLSSGDRLARADTRSAMYGNRVTIHHGAIYSNTNCGMVARTDVRDGRTDWIHYYRRGRKSSSSLNLGAVPVVAGDNVIFMPRDAGCVFALDQTTGRLIWENNFVQGIELVGLSDDLLIVRGAEYIVALKQTTGEIGWYQPLSDLTVGRSQMIDSSIYVAQADGVLCLDAETGFVKETRRWNLDGERLLAAKIYGRNLYLVTNKPLEDAGRKDARPLSRASTNSPLTPVWSLPRSDAKVVMAPKDFAVADTAYIVSEGILECIDMAASGKIRWQRFVNTIDAQLHLAGKTVFLLDRVSGRIPGVGTRVVAYDADNGHFLWEQRFVDHVSETLNCGSCQLFHRNSNRLFAVDLTTGKRSWTGNLGYGIRMKPMWDGQQLHVVYLTAFGSGGEAVHKRMDVQKGIELSHTQIKYQTPADSTLDVRHVKVGDFDVGKQLAFIKSHSSWHDDTYIFRYSLDEKPAHLTRVLPGHERPFYSQGPYYIMESREKERELTVYRYDDQAYQFTLGSSKQLDRNSFSISGDRLVTATRGILVANLAKKQIVFSPTDLKQWQYQNGIVLRQGPDILWKIGRPDRTQMPVFRCNLKTGEQSQFILNNQDEPFDDRKYRTAVQFEKMVLLSNDTSVTAWVVDGEASTFFAEPATGG